jgi:hypothetical protein
VVYVGDELGNSGYTVPATHRVGYSGYTSNVAGQTTCGAVTSPVTAVTPPAVSASLAPRWLEQPGVTAVTLAVTARHRL